MKKGFLNRTGSLNSRVENRLFVFEAVLFFLGILLISFLIFYEQYVI
jgi:hypothetical protein